MPKGNPKPQTIASEKYQKKAGYMVKGFKLKKEIVQKFEDACAKDGVSQAGQIAKLMKEYVEKVNREHPE
ncbi:chemotaxis protein [Lachnospiraceae bacterium 50-23]